MMHVGTPQHNQETLNTPSCIKASLLNSKGNKVKIVYTVGKTQCVKWKLVKVACSDVNSVLGREDAMY